MKKVSRLIMLLLVIGSLFIIAGVVIAQQQGGNRMRGNQQDRPQFDPTEMMKRRVDQIMEQLKPSSAEEGALLKSEIEKIMQARMDQGNETRELMTGLREAVNEKNTEKIKSSLAKIKAIKTKRQEQQAKMDKMENDLIELLTPEQEAILTLSGVVNSDGGMGGGGFFGGPGAPGGTGQNRGNRTGGQQRQQQN